MSGLFLQNRTHTKKLYHASNCKHFSNIVKENQLLFIFADFFFSQMKVVTVVLSLVLISCQDFDFLFEISHDVLSSLTAYQPLGPSNRWVDQPRQNNSSMMDSRFTTGMKFPLCHNGEALEPFHMKKKQHF